MAKRSPIWDYFAVKEDVRFVECNRCHLSISREGATTKTFNTSNLIQHLQSNHIEDFKEYEKAQNKKTTKKKKTSQSKQITFEVTEERVRKTGTSDAGAQRITRRVAEMVTLDCQPLSIIEDTGFLRLMNEVELRYVVPSRKHITDVVLPRELQQELQKN